MFRKFTPDLDNWRKEGRGVYVSNDGLSKVEHRRNRWVPFTRATPDDPWQESRSHYGALHAAQSHCNRHHNPPAA